MSNSQWSKFVARCNNKTMNRRVLLGVVAGIFVALGCGGGSQQQATNTSAKEILTTVAAEKPVIAMEMTAMQLHPNLESLGYQCEPTNEESCNAIDENCDGVIDEGCGYGSGRIQITASWNRGADIDLYVVDPTHETLSFQRRSSSNGGRIDHAGRGDCARSKPNARVENARWVTREPPRGDYEVWLHYWGACLSDGGPVDVTLSISIDSKVFGPFRYSLVSNERVVAIRFATR